MQRPTHTPMLILMVCPSLKARSNFGLLSLASSLPICSDVATHLKNKQRNYAYYKKTYTSIQVLKNIVFVITTNTRKHYKYD